MTSIFHLRTLAGTAMIMAVLFQANGSNVRLVQASHDGKQAEEAAQRGTHDISGIQSTGGSRSGASSTIASAAPHAARHIVVLSWKASVPASNMPGDAIKGYIVYRSTQSNDQSAPAINTVIVPGTTCTDDLVENGETYFYVVKAVNQNGKSSGPSNEAKAVIPKNAGPGPAPTGPFLLCREAGRVPLK